MSARLCLGTISGARGVKGEVRIKTFTAEAMDIASYGPLSDEAGEQQVVIASLKPSKEGVVAMIEGVADRDAAEALKGLRLYVDRDVLPAPDEDEFYHADLIGLRAELADGTLVGLIGALHDFGAGELVEIEREDVMPLLLPFTKEVVPQVSIEEGRIVVAAEALLEDEQKSSASERTKKRRMRRKKQK